MDPLILMGVATVQYGFGVIGDLLHQAFVLTQFIADGICVVEQILLGQVIDYEDLLEALDNQ